MEKKKTKYILEQVSKGVVVHDAIPKIDYMFTQLVMQDELDSSRYNGDNFFDSFSVNRNNINRLNILKNRCAKTMAQNDKAKG